MKILHVIATSDPKYGGPIEGILRSSPALARAGITRELATLDHPSDPWLDSFPLTVFALGQHSQSERLKLKYLPWVRYGYSSKLIPWLKENVNRYDVVLLSGLWNFSTLAARSALSPGRVPYFVFTHGMLDPWFRKTYPVKSFVKQLFWWFNEGPLLNKATGVLFTSEEEQRLAKNAFWPYHLKEFVIGYGTSDRSGNLDTQISDFRAALPRLAERRYLLFLSRIHPKKGCDILISAFATIASKEPDLDLVVAGPDQTGWVDRLKKQAVLAGVAERIHWPGMLQNDLKWGAFQGCEAFILPSHQENFGIVVAEALACAKPVLITDKVNIWREIKGSKAGLVEPDTEAGITSLLRSFCNLSEQEKADMRHAARETFLEHFNVDRNMHKLLDVFRQAGVEIAHDQNVRKLKTAS